MGMAVTPEQAARKPECCAPCEASEQDTRPLCRKWARGKSCDPVSCKHRHVLLTREEEEYAQMASAQREAALRAQRESGDVPDGSKQAHGPHHAELVNFVRQTFGDEALRAGSGVLNVGSGRGDVSFEIAFELHCRLRIPCALLEDRDARLRGHQRKYLRKHDAPPFRHFQAKLDAAFAESAEGAALLAGCTLLGLHPDEETEVRAPIHGAAPGVALSRRCQCHHAHIARRRSTR